MRRLCVVLAFCAAAAAAPSPALAAEPAGRCPVAVGAPAPARDLMVAYRAAEKVAAEHDGRFVSAAMDEDDLAARIAAQVPGVLIARVRTVADARRRDTVYVIEQGTHGRRLLLATAVNRTVRYQLIADRGQRRFAYWSPRRSRCAR